MTVGRARLAPMAGDDGLAVRFGDVTLFCAARQPIDAVADLIGRCRSAAGAEAPGAPLARQLAGLLAGATIPAVPPFALVAPTGDGLVVLVHGPVNVEVARADGRGDETISGASSSTWVDRRVDGGFDVLRIGPTGASGGPAAPDVDLIDGIVAAGGLWLEARDRQPGAAEAGPAGSEAGSEVVPEPAPEPPVADPPSWAAELAAVPPSGPPPHPTDHDGAGEDDGVVGGGARFESVLLGDAGHGADDHAGHVGDDGHDGHGLEDDRTPAATPLPVAPDPSEIRATDVDRGPVVVEGVVCSRGHFNDPRSRFCSSCGISMVHQTQNLVSGPRPPLGVVVFEDGSTYALSASYVVGRQPDADRRVRDGEALPLVLADAERTVSRAHAELRLDGWDVLFVNLSSTNGSFVWDATAGRWEPVTDRPVVLAPGTRIAMGQRTAVFESSLVR